MDGHASGAEGLTFRILGPLQVLRCGVGVNLGGPRQRVVLARLLVDPGHSVPLGVLAEAIWSGAVPRGYVSTVQTYVFHLRRSLEPARPRRAPASVLVGDSGGYRLAVQRSSVDAAQFEDLLAAGAIQADAGEHAEAVALLKASLSLWRGPVLADLAEFGFVAPLAARLEELRLRAAETQIDHELALGRHGPAVAELSDLIRRYPLHERLHEQRMVALYRCGRQSDALAAYSQLRALLVEELGVEPAASVRDLHRRILHHDPLLASDQRPATSKQLAAVTVAPRRGWPRRPNLSSRTVLVALATVLLFVLPGAATSGRGPRTSPGAGSVTGTSIVGLRPDGTMRAAFAIDGAPTALAVSGGSAWVADTDESTVRQIDLTSGLVRQRLTLIPAGGVAPVALTVLGDRVWVANNGSANVSEINAATGHILASISVGHHPSAITTGLGSVWVTDEGDATVTRIDPVSGHTRVIDVGDAPDGIAVGDDAVWVANRADNTVARIDPTNDTISAPLPVGAGPVAVAVSPRAIWVADSLDQTLSRIDTRTLDVTKTRTGDNPTDVTLLDGNIWASIAGSASIDRVDPNTGERTAHYPVGGAPGDLVAARRTVWTVSHATPSRAHRGGTLIIATTAAGLASIDPVAGYGNLGMVAMIYDGLVGLDAADGASAYELVPDLALTLPTPTAGGTVYTFTLRKGLHYSDGRPVQAGDFRTGLQRAVRIMARLKLPGYYLDIVGAAGCARAPQHRCDLTGGVATDDHAGTVTIRLTRADPDFLTSLAAFTLATPAPPSTPTQDVGAHPIPGTGPYRISHFVPGRSLVLVRNPYFRTWSSAARPDGYPDVIRWVVKATADAAVHAAAAGAADAAYVDPSNASQLARTYRDRLKLDPYPGTHYLVANSTIAPFDNPIARQALATAFTQDPVIARLVAGQPACTIVPPGWPGQRETCPYTHSLATAHNLVERSHTAGAIVRVFFVNYGHFRRIGEHVTDVLNRIGYKAHLTLQDNYDPTRYDAHTRPVNIEGYQWWPDFPAISQFYTPLLSCTGQLTQLGCNPALDRAASSALQTQPTDPGAAQRTWERVYSSADRDARLIANSTALAAAVLESPRVGNTHWNPFSGLVLDQLWVR